MAIIPTGDLLRAARALVGWSQTDLAEASGLSRATINRLENRKDNRLENRKEADNGKDPDNFTLESFALIVEAYATKGIEFTEKTADHGAGIRWQKPDGPPVQRKIKKTSRGED
jgi:transcriptional regulator with XRE-family HTH domain